MGDNKRILVTNIQRFSLHDGPGIRTTVFLKGCSLHCPWCANPENLLGVPQTYTKDGASGVYGTYMTVQELYTEVMKDRMFYGDTGGVTFSGGEPLLQMSALKPLLQLLRQENVHICMETSLFVPSSQLVIAIQYTDLFFADCKILDSADCQTVLGGNVQTYLENLQILYSAEKPVIYRIPVIGGYTDFQKNVDQILQQLAKYPPNAVELLPGHRMGASKYHTLGMEPPEFSDTDPVFLDVLCQKIQKLNIPCSICRI